MLIVAMEPFISVIAYLIKDNDWGEGDFLPSLSLDKLAAIINGRILVRINDLKIPFAISQASSSIFKSITFLDKPFKSERIFLTQLKTHDVRCLVTNTAGILNLERWRSAGIAVIEAEKLRRAYRDLAKFHKNHFSLLFVQVIGSSGKTTTTEMIGTVLREKFRTLVTLNNTNSPLGVADNLFRLNKHHRAAVLEVGMKAPGIMRITSSLIGPDIGVVTSIHRAHLTRLGSIQKIIDAKAEILEFLSPTGTLIINWADPNCRRFPLHRYKGNIIRYGFTELCDVWASDIHRLGFSTHFTVNTSQFKFPCIINIIGNYNVGNALAAVAVGLIMRMKPTQIARGLARFEPVDGRLKVYPKSNGAVIIDDNFNANPDSTRMLIDELIAMALDNSIVLVLGDMERPDRDIEKYARRVHFNIGRHLARGNFHHVLAIGTWAGEYVKGALHAGFPAERLSYYHNVQAAQNEFDNLLMPGNTVVLKASPYTKLTDLHLNSAYK